ncbi:MAG: ABC-ATPase domain-containing protein [Moorellales bacterium]
MQGAERLAERLRAIDGRGYKAYQALAGGYAFPDFELYLDHIQGDPFASPSRLRVRVPEARHRIPDRLLEGRERRIAACDFLARQVARAIRRLSKGHRGTGHSGLIAIDEGGQEILERTAVAVGEGWIEARLFVGLPAAGRTVLAREAQAMFFEELPAIVRASLFYTALDPRAFAEHVALAEDAEFIRRELPRRGLVAFVGEGAILPRRSGISDLPMPREQAVAFVSPPSLAVEFETPNHGRVRGMGVPAGVTLIVGGGYHGKSTLLRALERGVYNHIPGDGREWVITIAEAVKIRAEDGRRVEKVDISPFIQNLPFGRDTRRFSTEEASGSTSQAANIMEALELGARLLLIDEDTSATNFMIRDVRMQRLVTKEKEPITPFLDKVRQLYEEKGVSSILVVGGSGDYLDVADTVIMMDEYRPQDVTGRAKEVAREYPTRRRPEGGPGFGSVPVRVPLPESFHPLRHGKTKVEARGLHIIRFGEETIQLQYIEQLVDPSQTRAIAAAILYLAQKYSGRLSLAEAVHRVMGDVQRYGLEVLAWRRDGPPGDLACPRPFELGAAINRMRSLQVAVADELAEKSRKSGTGSE